MSPERTLLEVVRLSAGFLESHGSTTPRLDAELLAAAALDLRRLDLYLQFDRPLDETQLAAIRGLVRRRGSGEPVAHITGVREFWKRPFSVSAAVLIPRPDTETLVGLAIDRARAVVTEAGAARVADLGTGSGCIAVSLAADVQGASVAATDVSDDALAVARTNAARHGVADRVEVLRGSWADALGGRDFDVIVANPPYIPSAEVDGLDRDVAGHEPRAALDGGADGLDAYRALFPSAAAVLAPGGWLAVEIDVRGAAAVEALGRSALGEAVEVSVHHDLTGRPRVVAFALRSGGE